MGDGGPIGGILGRPRTFIMFFISLFSGNLKKVDRGERERIKKEKEGKKKGAKAWVGVFYIRPWHDQIGTRGLIMAIRQCFRT